MSHLDILTQITMRQNLHRMTSAAASDCSDDLPLAQHGECMREDVFSHTIVALRAIEVVYELHPKCDGRPVFQVAAEERETRQVMDFPAELCLMERVAPEKPPSPAPP
ncbi:Protein of unknown function, partial [Gryllus bimaculatus]